MMPFYSFFIVCFIINHSDTDNTREQIKYFQLNGQRVKVTHHVDKKFYGKYSGSKEGYLLLRNDGTGEYLYDLIIGSDECDYGPIAFEWGFLLDDHDEIVNFTRDYGLSYPVLFRCAGKPCFQLCQKEFMVEYILEKGNKLIVSSSDDWIKNL